MRPIRWHASLKDMLVPIDSVAQHPDNPNATDLDPIIESIQVNGFYTPALAQTSTRYLLDGNHRYQALQMLGATHIPVLWLDVDETKAKRILLATNRITRLGTDDPAMVLALLDDVLDQEATLALAGTGYDAWDQERLQELIGDTGDDSDQYARQRSSRHFTCPNCGWEPST